MLDVDDVHKINQDNLHWYHAQFMVPEGTNFTGITEEAARTIVSVRPGEIELETIEHLSTTTLRLLTGIGGSLRLGIPCLREGWAQILSNHQGGLELPNVSVTSREEARLLSKNNGDLILAQHNGLTHEIAKELADHVGELELSITFLDSVCAKELVRHRGGLCFPALRDLGVQAAEQLALSPWPLKFRTLDDWDESVIEALCQHAGTVSLFGLTRKSKLELLFHNHRGLLKHEHFNSIATHLLLSSD